MPNCFVKKLFGLLFMTICYFSLDLGYKPPKKFGNTAGTVSAHAAQKTRWMSALTGGLNIITPVRLSKCMYSYRIQQDDTMKKM